MPKFRVHQYVVVRVPVEVEANSMLEAIKKAEDIFEPNDIHAGEYAEEILSYLVDPLLEDGEADCDRSVVFDYDAEGNLIEDTPENATPISFDGTPIGA